MADFATGGGDYPVGSGVVEGGAALASGVGQFMAMLGGVVERPSAGLGGSAVPLDSVDCLPLECRCPADASLERVRLTCT